MEHSEEFIATNAIKKESEAVDQEEILVEVEETDTNIYFKKPADKAGFLF